MRKAHDQTPNVMNRFKILVVLVFAIGAVSSCFESGPKQFAIADSKKYEASLFRQNCAICHGPEANGRTLENGTVVPNLRQGPFKYASDGQIYDHIANGGNGMVSFRNQLTEREIRMMVEFVQRDLRGN